MRNILFIMLFILATSFTIESDKKVSWYGEPFHGRTTANGEIYDMNKFTCATTWNAETRRLGYPFGTKLKVTNVRNGKSVIVTVNDTGSFGEKYGRHLDLSKAAFDEIANLDSGVIKVKVKILKNNG